MRPLLLKLAFEKWDILKFYRQKLEKDL